jgi:hypothetical protein
MRRPKARVFLLCFLSWTGLAITMLVGSSMETSAAAVYWTLGLVLGGLAVTTGALAAWFRFTEQPTEITVRDYAAWDEPPVIHLKR